MGVGGMGWVEMGYGMGWDGMGGGGMLLEEGY